jgi:hypothetical protein
MRLLKKHDRLAGDCFCSADMPHMLAGFGFDVDDPGLDPQQACEVRANLGLVRDKLRFLSVDDQVAIHRPPSDPLDLLDNLGQETGAIQAFPARIGVRIVFANIAQTRSPQYCVGHRMAHHVCIGMPDKPARMINSNSTQDEGSAFTQPMGVVANPNPHLEAPSCPTGERQAGAWP